MSRRQSFTEKRRARLAMKWDRLEKLESKHTITEPISVLALSTSAMRGLVQLGIMQADGGNSGLLAMARLAQQARQGPARMTQAPPAPRTSVPIGIVAPEQPSTAAGGGGGATALDTSQNATVPQADSSDTLSLSFAAVSGASQSTGLSTPWHPAAPMAGGGALPPRGGSGGPSSALVAASSPVHSGGSSQQNRPSAPAGSSSAGSSSALLSALGLGAGGSATASAPAPASGAVATATVSRNSLATTLNGVGGTSSRKPVIHPDTSPAFELITLDYNDGSVMVPGYEQLATPGGSVDLRAQVRDSATGTYTYTWNTTGLSDATSISGASSDDLTFQWDTTIATATTESVTSDRDRPQSERGQPDLHLLDTGRHGLGDRRDDLEQRHARPRPAPGRCTGVRQPERLGRRGHRCARDVDQLAQLQSEYPGTFAQLRLVGGECPADHRGRARAQPNPEHALTGLGAVDL